jgi:hypothetical protein
MVGFPDEFVFQDRELGRCNVTAGRGIQLPLESFKISNGRCLFPSYEGARDEPISFQCTESKVEGSVSTRNRFE